MARNIVQFQRGLSEPAFEQQYGTEEQCLEVVIASRWPRGFECPACGGRQCCVVTTRDLYQCAKCRRRTSPIAGTIFASTHLPLRIWFRAIYHLTQTKQGISSIELGRRLGVRQTTAWKIKHKLKQVMLERDATKRLTGRVEIDDAYLGGERSGGKRGRGAPGKTPFVAAVETTPEGKPVRLKLRRVTSFCATSIAGFAKRSIDQSVVSGGRQCVASVADAPQRSRERTHFRSSELTQQVRIDLWSVGQTSRYPTCLQATIPLFDCGNHSSAPTWIPRDMASAGGQ